ncbi:MAG: hypothetical protein QOJ27_862 [Sphingomonadales bacterium]|nr:hypothetical protein [Sphingomonadales bacterium]
MPPRGDYYGWVFANLAMVVALAGVGFDLVQGEASPSAAVIIVAMLFGLLALRGLKPE